MSKQISYFTLIGVFWTMPSHAPQLVCACVCVCVCVINNYDFTLNLDDLSSSGEEDDRSLGQLAASDVLSKLIDLVSVVDLGGDPGVQRNPPFPQKFN